MLCRFLPLNHERFVGFETQFFGLCDRRTADAPQLYTVQHIGTAQKLAAVGNDFFHTCLVSAVVAVYFLENADEIAPFNSETHRTAAAAFLWGDERT